MFKNKKLSPLKRKEIKMNHERVASNLESILESLKNLANPSQGVSEPKEEEIRSLAKDLNSEEISFIIVELQKWKERLKRDYFEEYNRTREAAYRDLTKPIQDIEEEYGSVLKKIWDMSFFHCGLIDKLIVFLKMIQLEKSSRT